MAYAAVGLLVDQVKKKVRGYIDKLTQGQRAGSEIKDELVELIPELESFEARHTHSDEDTIRRIKEVIGRAKDLVETHEKMVIQMKAAATFKAAAIYVRLCIISNQMHNIRPEIISLRKKLLEPRSDTEVSSAAAAEEQDINIPSYLGEFMRYLLLFPPELEVPARRLIALWVAEDLVRSTNPLDDNKSKEEIAESHLNELVDLGVLCRMSEKRNGKVKTCKIDDGRRATLLNKAKMGNNVGSDKIRRLVDSHVDDDGLHGYSFIHINGNAVIPSSVRDKDVVSFFSFNTEEGSKPGEHIGEFLRKCISAGCFTCLKVLDLEKVFRPKLSGTLGKLIAIKYLGLRWTFLEQLPNSVDELVDLQVLDVKHTYISVLPKSIWRMQSLRHLYLSEAYRTKFPQPPSHVGGLTALQTLWGAFVDDDTPIVGGLDGLRNIRKLALSCRSRESKNALKMTKQLQDINNWIGELPHLESLRLKSRDENNDAAYLHLTSLERNKELSSLYLLGKLSSKIFISLPTSLTNITLSGSMLKVDPFKVLKRLENLIILGLLGQSVLCTKMHCSKGYFPKLKVLRIWKLENLTELNADEGSLPCLEEVIIRDCPKLEFPDRHRLPRVPKFKFEQSPPESHIAGENTILETQPPSLPPESHTAGESTSQTAGENTKRRFTAEEKGKKAQL